MNFLFAITLLFVCVIASFAQKSKGSPEYIQQQPAYDSDNNHEALNKVSAQLLTVLAEIENMQEGNQQLKMAAEKRRNKFEFIRFGRK
ncbi:unnamed protein product [Caenorhabditis angaria]|uniref:Uncharacterized protein n=1 Tax=Caenorhabditis angaria TaxID=860376 RepID=A0A9P1J593_9PELO|nr:unnamed protein product [Caenorhabditis angaria]